MDATTGRLNDIKSLLTGIVPILFSLVFSIYVTSVCYYNSNKNICQKKKAVLFMGHGIGYNEDKERG